MSIERIDSTERMSRIVKHNHTVYLCGQTACDPQWDITEQTERCLIKVEDLFAAGGQWQKPAIIGHYLHSRYERFCGDECGVGCMGCRF